ncbi:MAG TPA: MBOAT family O-acyltransferase [Bdellovibrionales bacterium]|nr:MBOAT family O-acyltransferase [Bdellovibrionales bacterium]
MLFLPLVVLAAWAAGTRARAAVLLAASYWFYMSWNPVYILLLLASTVNDYVCALKIESTRPAIRRKLWLALSVGANLGILFYFKYAGFAASAVADITGGEPAKFLTGIVLPVGISFYTFQSLSYTIDVYRRAVPAERSFTVFALYLSFFPQLVAGPIERASHLLPELKRKLRFNPESVALGLRYVLWGLFEKIVIADRLAFHSDRVWNRPGFHFGIELWAALLFFAFQIYMDFSAYSNIAIGSAKIFDVDLMENFRRPYFARSIQDFWRRWHISLSTWFRDYVYLPLGGSHGGRRRHLSNLIIVFTLSGLWHGASYNFFLWGLLHGIYLCVYVLASRATAVRIPDRLSVVLTFFFVLLTWVPFRVHDPFDIGWVYTRLFVFDGRQFSYLLSDGRWTAFAAIAVVVATELLRKDIPAARYLSRFPRPIRWVVYYILMFSILMFGVFENKPFIYFQF